MAISLSECKQYVKSLNDPFHCLACGGTVDEHPLTAPGILERDWHGVPLNSAELLDYICFVIDRSGSMIECKQATIDGFNTYLRDQRKVGKALFTLVQFDNDYQVLYDGVPIGDVAERNGQNYLPRGGTALFDAMGRAIVTTAENVAKLKEKPRSVIFAIITDGQNNASREYTRKQVFDLRDKYQKEGWEFFFLGAEEASIKEAEDLGFARTHYRGYNGASGQSVGQAFHAMSVSNSVARSSGSYNSVAKGGEATATSSRGFDALAPEDQPDAMTDINFKGVKKALDNVLKK